MNANRTLTIVLTAVIAYVPASSFGQSDEQSKRTAVKNAALLETLEKNVAPPPIEPVIGRYEKVVVRKGESLFDIARAHNVSLAALRRVNGLKSDRVKPGKSLLLPSLHVLPRNPGDGIVLNVPERALYVIRQGAVEARYPVAVGQSTWQTALGEFRLRKKLKNPPWKPTKEMVEREGISDEIVPPGPKNPLGDRWMGWSAPGFGFHSTIAPRSIGTAASHGCVRLYPEAAHALFDQVAVGMPIYSVYEPVLVGTLNGRFYLTVFPDIYHTGLASPARVGKELEAAGIADLVDAKTVQTIVRHADGYPHRIIGSDEPLTVNGTEIRSTVAPTRVKGQWVVPAREVAAALGGQVTVHNGSVVIQGGGRTLTLKPAEKSADIDGQRVTLEIAPTVLKGVTVAPLGILTEALGARVAWEKGKGVEVTSVSAGDVEHAGRRAEEGRPRVKTTGTGGGI